MRLRLQSCQQEIELDERGKLFRVLRVPGLCVENKGRKRRSRRTRAKFHWEHIPLHAMATRPRKQFHLYSPPSNPSSNLPFDFLYLSLSRPLGCQLRSTRPNNVLARATRVVGRLFHAALTIAGCKQRPAPLMDVPDN